MTKFENPIAPKAKRLMVKSNEIKGWVRNTMGLPADTPITIAELACQDEECPDVETVIGILEPKAPLTTLRIHSPMKMLSRTDIAEAVCTAKTTEKP